MLKNYLVNYFNLKIFFSTNLYSFFLSNFKNLLLRYNKLKPLNVERNIVNFELRNFVIYKNSIGWPAKKILKIKNLRINWIENKKRMLFYRNVFKKEWKNEEWFVANSSNSLSLRMLIYGRIPIVEFSNFFYEIIPAKFILKYKM